MASFLGKFKTKRPAPKINPRKLAAFLLFLILAVVVYLIDGSPAGAFLSLIIITVFFSMVISHWRDHNE